MNTVSKLHLCSLLLVRLYEPLLFSGFGLPKAGNGQRGFAELVDTCSQDSSDKDYLNVLRGKDPRRKAGPNIGSNDRQARNPRRETAAGAGTRSDNKITEDPERERKLGTRVGIRVGIGAGKE